KALASKTERELLSVIKDNIDWSISNGLSIGTLKMFGVDILAENLIFIEGDHDVSIRENTTIALLGSSQATIKTLGSSRVTIKTLGSSQATIRTWGSSQATIETWDSSQATIALLDSSQAT